MVYIVVQLWNGDFRKQSRNAVHSTSALYMRGITKADATKLPTEIIWNSWRAHYQLKLICWISTRRYRKPSDKEDIFWSCSFCALFLSKYTVFLFRFWRNSPQWAMASSFTRFLDHTQRRNTVDRTPLEGWSARRKDLYPTTHNTHNSQNSMPPVGFEPTISAGERPQTYALDRAATGTGAPFIKATKCIV